MESVYPVENFPATKPLDLENYFKEYQAEVNITNLDLTDPFSNRSRILQEQFALPFSVDDIKQMEALCTVDKLKLHTENPNLPLKNTVTNRTRNIEETHKIVTEAKTLATVKSKEELNNIDDPTKYYEMRCIGSANDVVRPDVNAIKNIEPGSVFIQKVLVLMPLDFLQVEKPKEKQLNDNLKIQYEIDVLSTNTLLDLANSLKCISDMLIIKEVDNMDVNTSDLRNPIKEYPSRCFFIENVFYNDMSLPNAIDYSEVIRKWAIEKGIGHFKTESMNVTIGSLKPRFGYGYVYIHQGNCEHVVCFSDARLLQNCDHLDFKKYPRVLYTKCNYNQICFICSLVHASWLVTNSDRLPVRKAFLCNKCCKSFMFLDGEKVGKFQLFPLIYNTCINTGNEEEN